MLRGVVFAGFGLLFGSFLTVVVHRVPEGLSVVRGRSRCDSCGATIRMAENIPLLSYALLGGRCRHCDAHISAEYPMVEALTGVLFVGAALLLPTVSVAALVAPFLGVLAACALIDLRHRIIPNRIVYPSYVIFGLAIGIVAAAFHDVGFLTAILGSLAFGGGLLLVALASPNGMGMGDVKLAALIGLVLGALGWRYVAVAAMSAVLAGGGGAIALLVAGRTRKDTLPFGPYLAAGAMLSALFAPQIAGWYMGLAV